VRAIHRLICCSALREFSRGSYLKMSGKDGGALPDLRWEGTAQQARRRYEHRVAAARRGWASSEYATPDGAWRSYQPVMVDVLQIWRAYGAGETGESPFHQATASTKIRSIQRKKCQSLVTGMLPNSKAWRKQSRNRAASLMNSWITGHLHVAAPEDGRTPGVGQHALTSAATGDGFQACR
jgi:hypothetical protein